MLEDIKFAAGCGWAVAYCVDVAVQLEEVVVMLGVVIGVKVVPAAKVCEGALLAELYGFAVDVDGEGCGGGLFWVGAVVLEFVCPKFGRC
jgi:hypothetical protein